MQFRHYSFDLWLTLIRSHPEGLFKRLRATHIWERYGKKTGRSIDDVELIIRDVEKWGDAINLMNGKSIDALEMYAMVIFRVQGHLQGISPLSMELLYREVELIFYTHPPVLYDDDTFHILEELRKRGKTLSLLSNTGFIQGRTLEILLEKLHIREMFIERIYSDQVNLSKPNRDIFKLLNDKLPYDTEDIIHIGDNPVCDGAGAQEYGFGSMVINSNSYTIKDIL